MWLSLQSWHCAKHSPCTNLRSPLSSLLRQVLCPPHPAGSCRVLRGAEARDAEVTCSRRPVWKCGGRELVLFISTCPASQVELSSVSHRVRKPRGAAATETASVARAQHALDWVQRTPFSSSLMALHLTITGCHTRFDSVGNSWKTVCSVPLTVSELISTW